jgi:hypothetical protein
VSLICPVCKTKNTKQDSEVCVQCGSDLHVHRLLYGVSEEIQVKDEKIDAEKIGRKKLCNFFTAFQMVPAFLLLIAVIFGICVGMRFLQFLERAELQRTSQANKWSETGYEQLQQMHSIINKELDVILDQRRENQALQVKIEELSAQIQTQAPIQKNKTENFLFPSLQEEPS